MAGKTQPLLSQVLDLGQGAECTDSRDKIYGLLSLFPQDISQVLLPDYDKSARELYIEFAGILLAGRGLTGLLSWCCSPEQTDLPSWVPNWKIKFPRNHLQWLVKRKAGGQSAPSILDIEKGKLHCTGILIDSIRDVSQREIESLPYRIIAEIKSGWKHKNRKILANHYGHRFGTSLALQRTLLMDHPNKTYVRTALPFHRIHQHTTLIGNIYWVDHDVPRYIVDIHGRFVGNLGKPAMQAVVNNALWEDFDRFRQANADFDVFGHSLREFFPSMNEDDSKVPFHPPRLLESTNTFISSSNDSCKPEVLTHQDEHNMILTVLALAGRRLATTKTGYLALIPEETCEKDVISVLRGCNFPVVLRPAADGHYKYVGECYVDGLMDGEAFEAVKNGDLKEVEFVLV